MGAVDDFCKKNKCALKKCNPFTLLNTFINSIFDSMFFMDVPSMCCGISMQCGVCGKSVQAISTFMSLFSFVQC